MDTSYLTQQVTTIIGQLHKFFDEIGVPSHERDSRESELFASLSETLHNQLRLVANEKNELVEKAQHMIAVVQQMEASLDDPQTHNNYASRHEELKVTFPLHDCLQNLQAKHKTISKLHKERYEQVKKLVQALESYSSHLEADFLRVKLPPSSYDASVPPTFDLSPSYINSVDSEFTRVYEEYNRRITVVQQLADEIIKLWAELGTPQAQTVEEIVKHSRDSPEQLGLHKNDLAQLESRRDRLQEEKRNREKKVQELKNSVEQLWDRLKIDDAERKRFLSSIRGCGLRVINDLEDEMQRLHELKRQNLHLFVEDARTRMQALWDEMFFSDEEAAEFTPMFCDVYSDALLSAHEAEIERLETLRDQRAPTLQMVSKHRSLVNDKEELAASSQDASRLIAKKGERRDPTRLLREEKMRKRIAKELPKVEAELSKVLSRWEDEYGRPFLVFGERYLDTLAATVSSARSQPPQSKTPNALPPPQPKKAAPASNTRSARGVEPPAARPKTPAGTLTRQQQQVALSKPSAGPQSPSRIPARVPLGNMTSGSNSPERQGQRSPKATAQRKQGRELMAPPPKMRDVHLPPPTPEPETPQDVLRSGSLVRNVMPEDPYRDGMTQSYRHANPYQAMPPPPRPGPASVTSSYADTRSDASSSSRQISNSSSNATSHTGGSGSENWETFGDDSEPERDATEAYYAKVRAAKAKRSHEAANGYHAALSASQAGKKMKAYHQHGLQESVMQAGEEHRLVEGSEAGWTDEDFY